MLSHQQEFLLVGKEPLRRNTKEQNVGVFVPQDEEYVSIKAVLIFSAVAVGGGRAAAIQDQTAGPTLRARQKKLRLFNQEAILVVRRSWYN